MFNRLMVEAGVRIILKGLGEDTHREGLKETPSRVAQFYKEWIDGKPPNMSLFGDSYGNMVIVKHIPFYSLCEHHILPFIGTASIGYIPGGKVLGLSKVVRILYKHSHKLQMQERLTEQVADELSRITKGKGVMVVIEAEHLCMSMRGVRVSGSKTVTSSIRGVFTDNGAARTEFLELIR